MNKKNTEQWINTEETPENSDTSISEEEAEPTATNDLVESEELETEEEEVSKHVTDA